MKKNRILAGIALTAGLGLTGVATAPVSSATGADPVSGRSAQARPAKAAPDHKDGRVHIACIVRIGKPGDRPGLPPLPGKPPKGGPGKAGRTTVKIVNGKVYINGKPAPKGSVQTGDKCPALPPLPPKGGKSGKSAAGGVIVRNDVSGPVTEGAGEPGPSASAVLG